jgi:molybdopterin molybdotransferase
VEVLEPGFADDPLLPRHADRLTVEEDRVAARDEEPDAVRAGLRADLLLEIPAELGNLEAGSQLWAQLLRLPIF